MRTQSACLAIFNHLQLSWSIEAVEEEEEFSTGYLFVNLDILMWCGEQQKQMMMMLHDIHKADV